MSEKPEDVLSNAIIGAAIEVHRTLGGPGLLESVYEEALVWELEQGGHTVERQLECPILYKGKRLGQSLRIDLVVDDIVIVECKATAQWNPLFDAQTLTYLRLSEKKLGLVLNFGEQFLKDGIHRVVNGL